MKTKTFIITMVAVVLSFLVFVGGIVYYVDPYFQYHVPNDRLAYNMETNNFSYYNAGIAKNFEYDTIITGSSMSRAFLPSYIDEKFQAKTVKLSMAEARGKDFSYILPLVLKNKNTKRVIIGIDTFAYNVDKDYSAYDKPEYLYDDNPLNDVLYLMNMDGLIETFKTVRYTLYGGTTTTMDQYQNYALSSEFSKAKVLQLFKNANLPTQKPIENKQLLTQTILENLKQNIIPYIKDNEDVQFYLYIAPYSVIKWQYFESIETELYTMKVVIEQLIGYDNVSIFFAQGEESIICDLDHYMDSMHYDSVVANKIVDMMKDSNNKMSEDTYIQELERFAKFIKEFDYDALIKDGE